MNFDFNPEVRRTFGENGGAFGIARTSIECIGSGSAH